jgi:hypothetical protein
MISKVHQGEHGMGPQLGAEAASGQLQQAGREASREMTTRALGKRVFLRQSS